MPRVPSSTRNEPPWAGTYWMLVERKRGISKRDRIQSGRAQTRRDIAQASGGLFGVETRVEVAVRAVELVPRQRLEAGRCQQPVGLCAQRVALGGLRFELGRNIVCDLVELVRVKARSAFAQRCIGGFDNSSRVDHHAWQSERQERRIRRSQPELDCFACQWRVAELSISPRHVPKPKLHSVSRRPSSYVNATSSAVSGLPSWKVASTREQVIVTWSGCTTHGSAARSGTGSSDAL